MWQQFFLKIYKGVMLVKIIDKILLWGFCCNEEGVCFSEIKVYVSSEFLVRTSCSKL